MTDRKTIVSPVSSKEHWWRYSPFQKKTARDIGICNPQSMEEATPHLLQGLTSPSELRLKSIFLISVNCDFSNLYRNYFEKLANKSSLANWNIGSFVI